MRTILLYMFAMLVANSVVGDVSDLEIKSAIERSTRFEHPWDSKSEKCYAMRLCGYDTNRFVRVLQELVAERPITFDTLEGNGRSFRMRVHPSWLGGWHTGYFADAFFIDEWYHGAKQSAGEWCGVWGDNCFLNDDAGLIGQMPEIDDAGRVSRFM